MDQLCNLDWRTLLDVKQGPCVTIYMPTIQSGAETRQNAIRCKNLLNQAKNILESSGFDDVAAEKYLTAIAKLLDDRDFWQQQQAGLALFISPTQALYYKSAVSFEEAVDVGETFRLTPLVPLVRREQPYFILAVSLQKVRLFEVISSTSKELPLEESALSDDEQGLHQTLNIDEVVKSQQFRSHRAAGQGNRARDNATFYGSGGGGEGAEKKELVKQYMRRVDQAVAPHFANRQYPLVFAGVEYLFPLFKECCAYSHTTPTALVGNFDDVPVNDLISKAQAIIEPIQQERVQLAWQEYEDQRASDKTSNSRAAIAEAAAQGQIARLFLKYDAEHSVISADHLHGPDNFEVEKILADTLKTGGEVFAVTNKNANPASLVAALLRYPT